MSGLSAWGSRHQTTTKYHWKRTPCEQSSSLVIINPRHKLSIQHSFSESSLPERGRHLVICGNYMGSLIRVPEICLTWRLRQFRPKFVLVLEWDRQWGTGVGVLNARLWLLWNASWALVGQRRGWPFACLICACLCYAGDVIRHQLAGMDKSRPFPRLAVTVENHAPLQTWQAAHKSSPSLMLIRADRQWVTERCWKGRKCDWPHTASWRTKPPDVWSRWNNQAKFKFITAPEHGLRRCL